MVRLVQILSGSEAIILFPPTITVLTKQHAPRHGGLSAHPEAALSAHPEAAQLTGGWLLLLGLPPGLRVQTLKESCCPPPGGNELQGSWFS